MPVLKMITISGLKLFRGTAEFRGIPDFWNILEISVNLPRKKIEGGVTGLLRRVIYRWKALDLTRLDI